jgi:hypothetical protein
LRKGIAEINKQIKRTSWESDPTPQRRCGTSIQQEKLDRRIHDERQAYYDSLNGPVSLGRDENCTCRPFAINDDGTDPRDHNCPLHGCRGFDEPFGWCG